jgi:hypothetical protein
MLNVGYFGWIKLLFVLIRVRVLGQSGQVLERAPHFDERTHKKALIRAPAIHAHGF